MVESFQSNGSFSMDQKYIREQVNKAKNEAIQFRTEAAKEIDPDQVVKGYQDHFSCLMCLNIVKQPVECSGKDGCEKLLCKKCVKGWLLNNTSCPACRKDPFEPSENLGSFITNGLNQMEIKCEGCKQPIQYQFYENHMNSCDAPVTMNCPLACVMPAMSEQECIQHIMCDCKQAMSTCNRCELGVVVLKQRIHNCLQSLKEELKIGKGKFTGPVNLADFNVDRADGNSVSIDFRGTISPYFGLQLTVGKELKPDDVHTLMPMWPSRHTLSEMGTAQRQAVYIEKIKFYAEDSIKSLQFVLSNGNTSMMYGTSFPANKQAKIPNVPIAKIKINYLPRKRGVFGLKFYSIDGAILGAIQSTGLQTQSPEEAEIVIPENQRLLGFVPTCQISAVDGKSFLKGLRFVFCNID